MKNFILYFTICIFILLSITTPLQSQKAQCFSVEKWEQEASKKSTDKDMMEGLEKSCNEENPDDKAKARQCMRSIIERYLSIDGYKEKVLNFALNDAAKDKISKLIDACGNDEKKFFPCLADEFEKNCPEVKGYYRAEVRKLGYDV